MEAKIGITSTHLDSVAHSLNKIFADEFVLYTKTPKAHWCVTGADFHSKHLFFESKYQQLKDIIDDGAERIRTLGHFPTASLKEFLQFTHLTEQGIEGTNRMSFIKASLEDHESILINIRENINPYANEMRDAGTSDYITGLLETREKMAWMLRAHLE